MSVKMVLICFVMLLSKYYNCLYLFDIDVDRFCNGFDLKLFYNALYIMQVVGLPGYRVAGLPGCRVAGLPGCRTSTSTSTATC